jgi:hypothetical protein
MRELSISETSRWSPLVKAQAAGIDSGEIGVVVEGFDVGEKASSFIDA